MFTKNKALVGLMVITNACICSFALIQNEGVNFAKAEDVIHTVTIDCDHNHLPETTGYHSLLNEVGTEVNCRVMVTPSTLTFTYLDSNFSIGNPTNTDTSYQIIFYINGIVSFDLNFDYDFDEYGVYGLHATFYRGSTELETKNHKNIHFEDKEGLSTEVILIIPIRYLYSIEINSIVVKYSESNCRELSKQ